MNYFGNYLGIEIGGTKLQFAVCGDDPAKIIDQQRKEIIVGDGAQGILDQIATVVPQMIKRHNIKAIGIGFGGPVNSSKGRVIKSHQVDGWNDFPLADWCQKRFAIPAVIGNDCDLAALAETKLGAGRGCKTVFYVTVGTGIGGGLVIDGKLHHTSANAVAEIGHMRPSVDAISADVTVESIASGPGIVASVMNALKNNPIPADELLNLCNVESSQLTCESIAQAAQLGNSLAQQAIQKSYQTLGWAIAQVITLIAVERVIIGGGVSLMPTELFFKPLQTEIQRYVFPPLLQDYSIMLAELSEQVVLHGAMLLAASRDAERF